MKPIIDKQPPHVETELVGCEVFHGLDFGCVWHQHPEVELALVQRGGTERLVGDRISGCSATRDARSSTLSGVDRSTRVPGHGA